MLFLKIVDVTEKDILKEINWERYTGIHWTNLRTGACLTLAENKEIEYLQTQTDRREVVCLSFSTVTLVAGGG